MSNLNYIQQLIDSGIEQSKIDAITTTEGALLIIAGAGAGKTKSLCKDCLSDFSGY